MGWLVDNGTSWCCLSFGTLRTGILVMWPVALINANSNQDNRGKDTKKHLHVPRSAML